MILVATILLLAMPPCSSRPMLAKKCPLGNILDSGFLQEFKDETQLDLSHCNIQIIMPGAFDDMTQLETLSLYGNNLKALWPEIFHGCRALSSVDLSLNQHLKIFPNSSFLESSSIKELVLRKNGIENISSTNLQNLPSLERLDLSGNPICRYEKCVMKSAEMIAQWLGTEKAEKSHPDDSMLKNSSYGTMMRNTSNPGGYDFTLKPRFYPFFTFMVIFSGFVLGGCALYVACKDYDPKIPENEGFRKIHHPSDVDLLEVVSDDAKARIVRQRANLKKQLQLLYIIMKHSADCGVQPVKL